MLHSPAAHAANHADPVSPACAACGGGPLRPHLRVRRETALREAEPTTDRFGEALADLVACTRCGHAQLEAFPTEAELAAAYAGAASEDHALEEAGQRATARATLARIERHVPRGRLLDVGCWLGFLVSEAGLRGWEAEGLEPSPWAAARARQRLGVEVTTGALYTTDLPARAYDAIVLGDVLEHFVDPRAALERLATLLAPGGVLHLALPDAGSRVARAMGARWWSVLPTHVQYFTRGSLVELLRRTGFEPEWMGTAPKAFSVGYYLGRVNGYSPPVGRALESGARVAGLSERQWAPDFRDRMGAVARGPARVG